MTLPKHIRKIIEYIVIIFAGALYAVAIKYFIFPSQIIMTGTEGFSIATAYFFDNQRIFIWLYLIFQSMLLIFAFYKIGFRFAFRTALVIGAVVGLLSVLPEYQFASPEPQNERIILVIFGGILAGIAKAIAFRCGASTGDEDVLAAYFSMKYLKPVGSIAVIAAIVSTVFGLALAFIKTHQIAPVINTLMYTAIYIFMSAETLNNFYRKFKLALINVIAKAPEKIGESINAVCPHRTYTIQDGHGGYLKGNVKILRAIITFEELPSIVRAIENADKKAFFYYNQIEGVSKHYYISPIR
ncbi:MAG: YitT family protein [Candidatus Omnitrophica bacterium]|nr:YitT family protein [Candidatus Omnitrophota bacterium]